MKLSPLTVYPLIPQTPIHMFDFNGTLPENNANGTICMCVGMKSEKLGGHLAINPEMRCIKVIPGLHKKHSGWGDR